ncbi:MAG: DUF2860 domain-containing protein [Proteobacteria bacterium]|nr:DUF2860 domain-containing protein [Pseudomonadota bacterium]
MHKPIILRKICTITLFLFTLFFASASAENLKDENSTGFSGYVQPFIGIGNFKSLGDVHDENEKIDSLDQEAKSETEAIPGFFWQAAYLFENKRTQLHLGTPKTNVISGNFLFETGVSHELEGGTLLTAAWIPKIPGLDDEVWKDPYLTGRAREKTDRKSQAFSLGAENIFDSSVSLKYSFGTQDIDTEQSGVFLSTKLGSKLTAADLASLRRSGNVHLVESKMMVSLGKSFLLQPGLNYMWGDADGDVNSFNDFGGEITLMFKQPRYEVSANFSHNLRHYEKSNPVFAKKRDDRVFDTTITFAYLKPFGFENAIISLLAGYSKQNSSIKFYDSQSLITGVGIGYTF